jgi:predicted DNA-binding transcriptional regulator AlpA
MDMNTQNRTIPFDPLLSPPEAAVVLAVSLSWLAKARLRGDGPNFVKVGRAVKYQRSSLLEYVRHRTRTSTSQA